MLAYSDGIVVCGYETFHLWSICAFDPLARASAVEGATHQQLYSTTTKRNLGGLSSELVQCYARMTTFL